MDRVRRTALLVAAVLLLLSAHPALGWGVAGHHIVAAIAWSRLSPAAQQRIRDILGNGSWSIVDISTCPDVIRDTRSEQPSPLAQMCKEVAGPTSGDTGPWHYIDVPLPKHGKNLSVYCPNGNCLPVKLAEFERQLSASSDPVQKRAALMFVVHFFGDIHQPLHCVEQFCDQGGNRERVDFLLQGQDERNVSLHHVWDTSLVNGAMSLAGTSDEQAFAQQLAASISTDKASRWSRAGVDGMVWEGVAASKRAYRDIPRQNFCLKPPPAPRETALRPGYERGGESAVREQLMKAGVRLAAFLETALGNRNSEATR